MNRQDACSTKSGFDCGVGILPARERLIHIRSSIALIISKSAIAPLQNPRHQQLSEFKIPVPPSQVGR
jgi:hypothetical protein